MTCGLICGTTVPRASSGTTRARDRHRRAQTALAILADATGDDRLAVALHQDFKFKFVSRFPKKGFELTAEEVQRWAEEEAKRLDLSDWEEQAGDLPEGETDEE